MSDDFAKHAFYGERVAPLRVAVSIGSSVDLLLFKYLKHIKGWSLEINHRFAYAIEIMHAILNGQFQTPPELCVLGLAPALTLLSRRKEHPYRPLMFMPSMSHRVIAPKGKFPKKLESGNYYFLRDDPSTSWFYFEDLKACGKLRPPLIQQSHSEPHEVYQAMKDGDAETRVILFFPYDCLNEWFNQTSYLDSFDYELNTKETILFVHESLFSNRERLRQLDIGIRNAWLTLLEQDDLLEMATELYVEDRAVMGFLNRASGLALDLKESSRL